MESQTSSFAYVKILVAFEGSAGAQQALRKAVANAAKGGATITALTVDESEPQFAKGFGKVEEMESVRAEQLATLQAQIEAIAAEGGASVIAQSVVGQPAPAIVEFAQNGNFDLIVIGHTAQAGIMRRIIGSTAGRVVDQAHCDVLVVR